MLDEKTHDINDKLQCKNCSAPVTFKPGTKGLSCSYCGTYNEISFNANQHRDAVQKSDFDDFRNIDDSQKHTIKVLKCNSCGASASYSNNTAASKCAFCTAPLVISSSVATSVIKPKSIIPFVVDEQRALNAFRQFTQSKFFVAKGFKHLSDNTDSIYGMYIPYWTFDTQTVTAYTGERGEDYYDTETYTTIENGKNVTKTRRVTRTRWYDAEGQVNNNFTDLTVIASTSLPVKFADGLQPWNFAGLVPYSDAYLAGFSSELYNIGVEEGFGKAKEQAKHIIEDTIEDDIGGDRQRIDDYKVAYYNAAFRHVLLPIWINTYKYEDKRYYFLINGQTGEVQGEVPRGMTRTLWIIVIAIAVMFFIALMISS